MQVITGRVLISVAELPPPPPPPSDSPPTLLLMTLVKAEGLQISGNGGGFSPYAELVLGAQSKTSSLQDNSTNPVWNEEFRFNVTEAMSTLEVVLQSQVQQILREE